MRPSHLLAVAVVATLSVTSACTKKSEGPGEAAPTEGPILVGEVGSMTGTEATFGQSTHKGIMLAIDEINAAGGIKGRKVRDVSIDDQGKPEEASSAVTELITREKDSAILGEVASSISTTLPMRVMPTLLCRMSMAPKRACTCRTTPATAAESVTSAA